MPDREQISQPSLGSNELGTDTNDARVPTNISSGTDTQTHIAATSRVTSHEEKVENAKNNLQGTDFQNEQETDE